jgi:hypothetical protein
VGEPVALQPKFNNGQSGEKTPAADEQKVVLSAMKRLSQLIHSEKKKREPELDEEEKSDSQGAKEEGPEKADTKNNLENLQCRRVEFKRSRKTAAGDYELIAKCVSKVRRGEGLDRVI